MDRDNKYYSLIETLVKSHRKYPGYEMILEDIIDDVFKHSETVLSNINDETVIKTYLQKVVSTSIITVPKRMNFNNKMHHREITNVAVTVPVHEETAPVIEIVSEETVELSENDTSVREESIETDVQKANVELVDRMINSIEADSVIETDTIKTSEEIDNSDELQLDDVAEEMDNEIFEDEISNDINEEDVKYSDISEVENLDELQVQEDTEDDLILENVEETDSEDDLILENVEETDPEDDLILGNAEEADVEDISELTEGQDEVVLEEASEDIENVSETAVLEFETDDEEDEQAIQCGAEFSSEADIDVLDDIEENPITPENSIEDSEQFELNLEDTENEHQELSFAEEDSLELAETEEDDIETPKSDIGEFEIVEENDYQIETPNAELAESTGVDLLDVESTDETLEPVEDSEQNFSFQDNNDDLLNLQQTDDIELLETTDDENVILQEQSAPEETEVVREYKRLDYSIFNYNPSAEINAINESEISQRLLNLDNDNPDLCILSVFDLRYKQNLSIEKIAEKLNTDKQNVISALDKIINIV